MKYTLLLCFSALFFTKTLIAQVFVQAANELDGGKNINVYGQGNKRIPYNRIKGSPFWTDEYKLASLYDNENKLVKTLPVKFNIATNEVYFLQNGEELVLDDNTKVNTIIFFDKNDTSKINSVFVRSIPNASIKGKPEVAFAQVMNLGDIRLLKYTSRTVDPYYRDSLFGTQKKYQFKDMTFYYLASSSRVDKLKRLNEQNLIPLLPNSSSNWKFIKENKLDLKKEPDVIAFLNYLNAKSANKAAIK